MKKRYAQLSNFLKENYSRGIDRKVSRLNFAHVLFAWVGAVALLGLIYHFFQSQGSFLAFSSTGERVTKITDAVYFSFISSTTTGLGDIIPIGMFKLVSVLGVVFSIMFLAIVTSKIVSIKQDIILNELYELSFNEKINRLRSSLFLFRQNTERVINKIEDNRIKKREINNIYLNISYFEDILDEILMLITKPDKSGFIKNIDAVNTELIFNGIVSSFEKLHEMLQAMCHNDIECKGGQIADYADKCLSANARLFEKMSKSKRVSNDFINDITSRNNSVVSAIKKYISRQSGSEENKIAKDK